MTFPDLTVMRQNRRKAIERGFECTPTPTGGWILKAVTLEDAEIGAFSNTQDLLSFLNSELIYERPIVIDISPKEAQ